MNSLTFISSYGSKPNQNRYKNSFLRSFLSFETPKQKKYYNNIETMTKDRNHVLTTITEISFLSGV